MASINDITNGLSPGTNLAMYADDTKIWRNIHSNEDHEILQKDVHYLNDWATVNKMRFHPAKCKVLSVTHLRPPFLGILPEIEFMYSIGSELLDYCTSEKDLGLTVNTKLNWNDHCDYLIAKANQKFGLLRRTCHFVKNTNRRRVLYLTLVRSIFEHCPIIWRPSSRVAVEKLESVQKRALKWIFNDYSNYTDELYLLKCKSLNILPIAARLDFQDLNFFHSVFYNLSPVKLPHYLQSYEGTRLRSSHLDSLCLISSITPKCSASKFCSSSNREHLPRNFENSFFYRTHLAWNRLPIEIRQIQCQTTFKAKITRHIWKGLASTIFLDVDS